MKRKRFTEKQIISILQERAGECSAAIGQRQLCKDHRVCRQ